MAESRAGGGGAAALTVRLALVVGLAAPLLVLAAAMLTKTGTLDWRFGYGELTLRWAALLALAGSALGLVAVTLALKDRRLWLPAAVAFLAPAATLAGFGWVRAQAAQTPPVHDVSTNWEEPPMPSRGLARRRGPDAAPVERDPVVGAGAGPAWAGRRVAEINAETCPGARPVSRAVDFERVQAVLEGQGIELLAAAPWAVEGTHESWWFGFRSDVVVRIRPERTDVRAVGREDRPDLGFNCRLVTRIVEGLEAE